MKCDDCGSKFKVTPKTTNSYTYHLCTFCTGWVHELERALSSIPSIKEETPQTWIYILNKSMTLLNFFREKGLLKEVGLKIRYYTHDWSNSGKGKKIYVSKDWECKSSWYDPQSYELVPINK